jgi:ParB-like chromosome segregation protein Spo0J
MTESKKILETKDYKVFKYLKGNRTIQQSWVRKLVELIKERDLQIPIIVDETMKVLDGQHRLEAYKIVGHPVKYIIKDRFALDEVRALNSNNKKWRL